MSKRENDTNKLKDLIPQMLQENKLQKGMDQIYVKEFLINLNCYRNLQLLNSFNHFVGMVIRWGLASYLVDGLTRMMKVS